MCDKDLPMALACQTLLERATEYVIDGQGLAVFFNTSL